MLSAKCVRKETGRARDGARPTGVSKCIDHDPATLALTRSASVYVGSSTTSTGIENPTFTRSMMTIVLNPLMSGFS